MIVAMGNEDKLHEARLAHILQLFRQAHPEMQLCVELPAHGNEMTLLPILLASVYLGTGNCSSKIIHGSFFLQ